VDGYTVVYLPYVRLDYIDDGTLQCEACMDSYNGLSGYRKGVGSMTLQKEQVHQWWLFTQVKNGRSQKIKAIYRLSPSV
jgi:hypothetical protein